MPHPLRPWRVIVLALTTAALLSGCVAAAVFPIPTGSSSSTQSDQERK